MQKLVKHRKLIDLGLALAILAPLVGAGCAVWRSAGGEATSPPPTPTPTVRPTSTPEPLVPTPTDAVAPEASATATIAPSATPSPTALPTETPTETLSATAITGAPATSTATAGFPTSTPESTATAFPSRTPSHSATPTRSATPGATSAPTAVPVAAIPLPRGRARFGVGVAMGPISDYPIETSGLELGWYLNWGVRAHPARPGGAVFWQMVRVSEDGYRPDAAAIRAAAAANPGAFWIIGNEPDVRWQDDTTPERYAELYHELYHLLKEADPGCHVVIGGVSQPTSLRMAYLERILAAYGARYGAPMPVDVWNVHGFILREERDSWGIDIPPGMGADTGMLYEIDDHDDLAIFRSQLYAFRRWMADHGQRDKPLVVSEYGILMPSDYGFGASEVRAFMEGSFDVFLTATDGAVGYPPDGGRLVQWWCWYSLAAPEDYYPTGNLFDPTTKTLTPLGAAFAAYSGP